MSFTAKAYAILIIPEIQQPALEKKHLFLPLTLAYLLSEHIRFYFPMPEEKARLVDAAFDDLLKGLMLKSKGIEYLKDCSVQQMQDLIANAIIILTTDKEIEQIAQMHHLPCLYFSQNDQGETFVRSHGLTGIKEEEVRVQALGYAQLISVLSGGVLSKGHFSLSW